MQRLFSTFPGSWPGLGLLILRISVGLSPLLVGLGPAPTFELPWSDLPLIPSWPVLGVLGVCLVAGFATPIVSPLLGLAVVLAGRGLAAPSWLMLAGGSVSLMMLGPGAWSVDAWLYGRKRIRFGDD